MKYTPDNITKLEPNEVFVFGSNLAGKHLGGAAKLAVDKFGAEMGVSYGFRGQSFAIPTLDRSFKQLSLADIARYVKAFILFAELHPELTFYMTKIGCGIAGFSEEEISGVFASLRKELKKFPNNIVLPKFN